METYPENTPLYDLRYPYDCIRVIAGTILGEPRLKFERTDKESLRKVYSAKRPGSDETVFQVDVSYFDEMDTDDMIFGEELSINIESYLEIKDYGKYSYILGKTMLQHLCALLMELPLYNESRVISSNFKLLYTQLYNHEYIMNMMKLTNHNLYYNNSGEIDKDIPENAVKFELHEILFTLTESFEDRMIREGRLWLPLPEILKVFTGSLATILYGSAINFGMSANVPLELLFSFDTGTVKLTAEKLANSVITNSSLESLSKQRFITMSLLFSKIFDFYNYYTGYLGFNNPLINGLKAIGDDYKNIPEDELSEYVDTTILNQSDLNGYNITLESLLEQVSFITSPASYDATALKYDEFDRMTIALESNTFIIRRTPLSVHPLNHIFKISLENTNYPIDGIILGLFDFLNNLLINVPDKIDILFYSKLTLIAASLRYIQKNITIPEGALSYLKGGIMLADGAITYYFHEWFKNDKLYSTDLSVHGNDLTAYKSSKVAEVRCEFQAFSYVAFCIDLAGFVTELQHNITRITYLHDVSQRTYSDIYIDNDHKNRDTHSDSSGRGMQSSKTDFMPYYFYHMIEDVIKSEIDADLVALLSDGRPLDALAPIVFDYMKVFENELPSYILFSKYGTDSFTMGLMLTKKKLQESKFKDEALSIIENLESEEDSDIPMVSENRLALMLATNVHKIYDGKISDNKALNFLITILMKDMVPIGIAKECFSKQIEPPISFLGKDNAEKLCSLSYSDLFPEIYKNNKFNFLK